MNIYLFHSLLIHLILMITILKINQPINKASKKYYIDFISSKPQIITRNPSDDNPGSNTAAKQSKEGPEKKTQQTTTHTQKSKQIEDPDYLYKNPPIIKPSMAEEKSSILNDISSRSMGEKLSSSRGIKTDEDFPYPFYITMLRGKIWDNWQTQNIVSQNTSAVVKFKIYSDGKIKDIKIYKSSGNRLFDYSALNAIRSIKDLDPLPPDFSQEYVTVYVEFKAVE